MNRNYFAALDGFRALAIGLVVLHHISFRAFPGGHIGVDLFFVLSGFLITSVMQREFSATGDIRFVAFYIRRALRLAPALVLVCALMGLWIALFGSPGAHEALSYLATLTYTMDFVRAFSHVSDLSTLGDTWSLAIEEQFYLIWPAVALLLMRHRARWQIGALITAIVLVNLWRLQLYGAGATQARVYFGIDTRADQLLMGCALALWLKASPAPRLVTAARSLWPLVLIGLLLTARFDWLSQHVRPVEFSIVGLLGAILILELTQAPSGWLARAFSFAPVVYLGRISYGIYLWHYPVLLVTRYLTDAKIAVAAAIVLSIVMAALSYQFVELPILRLKQRFEPKGTPAVPAEDAENSPALAAPGAAVQNS